MIKTYQLKWETRKLCMCRHKAVNSEKMSCSEPFNVGRECEGNLNERPEWCPLIEHDIGMCHIKYKEESNRVEIKTGRARCSNCGIVYESIPDALLCCGRASCTVYAEPINYIDVTVTVPLGVEKYEPK